MLNVTILLLGLALLAYASVRSPNKTLPARFPHLKGWQKVFGVLASIFTLFIILNPEFLALGLLGDSAFFDMLVLAMSLQMHMLVRQAFHRCVDVLSRGLRTAGIPSLGMRYLLFVLTPVITVTVAAFQKGVHRILS